MLRLLLLLSTIVMVAILISKVGDVSTVSHENRKEGNPPEVRSSMQFKANDTTLPLMPSRRPTSDPSKGFTLVIVSGQIRGGIHCWVTFKRYLLDYYGADLALLKPQVKENEESIYWERRARYVLNVKEHEDWGQELTRINHGDASWEILVRNTTSFLGLLGGVFGHTGSSGILLAYRYYARYFLKEILQSQTYQWVVYVRSDYVYLCSPPHPLSLDRAKIYIPEGEGYGGFTDRFTILPVEKADLYFGMTEDLLSNSKFWYNNLLRKNCQWKINLECFIDSYLIRFSQHVELFPHVAFTVRRDSDPTRWAEGGKNILFYHNFGLRLKYPPEFHAARNNCEPFKQFTMLNISTFLHNF